MKQEIWKFVPYNTNYMVSNFGRVKSLNYNRTGKECIMKPTLNKNGYPQIGLSSGKVKMFLLHRLVWETFNGPIPRGYEINHINEDKTDCRLENLNLLTRTENNNWGTHNERMREAQLNRTDLSKRVVQYSVDGEQVRVWDSMSEIERELGFRRSNISNCCTGKYKTAYGFKWAYK